MSLFNKKSGLHRSSFLLFLVVIFLVFTLLSTANAELAQDNGTVGVSVGDWIKYSMSGEVLHLEGRDWAKIEVLEVLGTNVTVRVVGGETYLNETVSGSIVNGLRVGAGMVGVGIRYEAPFLLPKDFDINSVDEAFVHSFGLPLALSWDLAWNTGTFSRRYGETERLVNLLNVTYKQQFAEYTVEVHEEYYWDETSGLILEEMYKVYYLYQGSAILSNDHVEYMGVSGTSLFQTQTSRPFPIGAVTLTGIVVGPSAFGILALVVKNWMNRRRVKARQT